jgi:epoxide hydrolase
MNGATFTCPNAAILTITMIATSTGVLSFLFSSKCRRTSKSDSAENNHADRQHSNNLRSHGPVAQGWVTQAWRWVQLRQLCVALFLLISISSGSAQELTTRAKSEATMSAIRPFTLHVPDAILADLNRRLANTKWPDQLPGTSWEYGADIKKVRELADYWQNRFNWRAQEARINQYNQFTTEIDGQLIYFIHQRSPRPGAIPLMLIHGWPGSIVEFLALIDPLTQPENGAVPAFDVVIPALPGFPLSGPTTTRGWNPARMARAFIVLMDRLGYSRYGLQGGDWGSEIARDMAYQAPGRVIGLHLNFLAVDAPNPAALQTMSDSERRRFSYFQREESSFFNLQASEPQTLAYALTDSPVGWLAWMISKFQMLTDNNGDFLTAVDRDTFLTDVTLYWVTNTVGSGMRIYRENRLAGGETEPNPHLDTPVAYADFPKEVIASPLSWIKQTYNVVQVTEMPRGGHFAALEQPELLVKDMRTFFAKVGAQPIGRGKAK